MSGNKTMNNLSNKHLIKSLIDFSILLEFTDEKLLDSDVAVTAMEQLSYELQCMKDEDRRALAHQIRSLSSEYEDEKNNS